MSRIPVAKKIDISIRFLIELGEEREKKRIKLNVLDAI